MAIADLKIYFKQVEQQRNEMLDLMNQLDTALASGYYTEEQVEVFRQQYEVVNNNYERMAYEMHLLAIPNRHSRKMSKADQKLREKMTLVKCTDDYVLTENQDALVNFRKELLALTDTSEN